MENSNIIKMEDLLKKEEKENIYNMLEVYKKEASLTLGVTERIEELEILMTNFVKDLKTFQFRHKKLSDSLSIDFTEKEFKIKIDTGIYADLTYLTTISVYDTSNVKYNKPPVQILTYLALFDIENKNLIKKTISVKNIFNKEVHETHNWIEFLDKIIEFFTK